MTDRSDQFKIHIPEGQTAEEAEAEEERLKGIRRRSAKITRFDE